MYILCAALVFIVAVSADVFACGFAYGSGSLHVGFKKVMLINIIGSSMLGAGLFIGYFLSFALKDSLSMWLGLCIFTALGLGKLLQWLITRKKNKAKKIRKVTWRETILLGIMLSIDGMTAGIGASMTFLSLTFIFIVLGISLFSDVIFYMLGQQLGQKFAQKTSLDLGWLSGVVLLLLGALHFVL